MSAAAHILRRLHRRWVISCMQARMRQLDALVAELDAHIAADMGLLASLQIEQRRLRAQINRCTRPAPPAVPITWGL